MSSGFHTLTVAEIRRETDDAVAIHLVPPAEAAAAFAFRPGQHVTLRHFVDGEDIRRNYSLCAAPSDGALWIGIKQVPGGVFSSWANSIMKVGDSIEAMAPHGSFTWTFDSERAAHYAGFAAGSGITPILSIIKAMLVEEPKSEFTLIYGNRHTGSVMFLEELAALKDRYMDRLQVHHFLSGEEEEIELFNGRIDAKKLSDIFEHLVDIKSIDAAFICGPGAMMDAAETALIEGGLAPAAVLAERFTVDRVAEIDPSLREVLDRQAQGRSVSITIEGRKRAIQYDSSRGSILENARAASMPAPFACKAGVCATCRAKLTSGEVHMSANYGLTAEEVALGYVLTCQSVPLTDDVALDFDL